MPLYHQHEYVQMIRVDTYKDIYKWEDIFQLLQRLRSYTVVYYTMAWQRTLKYLLRLVFLSTASLIQRAIAVRISIIIRPIQTNAFCQPRGYSFWGDQKLLVDYSFKNMLITLRRYMHRYREGSEGSHAFLKIGQTLQTLHKIRKVSIFHYYRKLIYSHC